MEGVTEGQLLAGVGGGDEGRKLTPVWLRRESRVNGRTG